MKTSHTLICLAILAEVAGCSSTKINTNPVPDNAISSQRLSTGFQRQNTVVEWECQYQTNAFGAKVGECIKTGIKSIQTTGYALSYGNNAAQREVAYQVAHDAALDKMVRFIRQDINSKRVTNTLSKSIEKANAKVSKNEEGGVVSTTDAELSSNLNSATPAGNQNSYSNENTNSVVREFTETVQTQAHGIIRGARVVDERVVDGQTVSVTIRWDATTDRALSQQKARFSN